MYNICPPPQIGLEISKAVLSDAGSYECHLSNDVGTVSGACGVTVHKIFAPPFFSKQLSDVKQGSEGESAACSTSDTVWSWKGFYLVGRYCSCPLSQLEYNFLFNQPLSVHCAEEQ